VLYVINTVTSLYAFFGPGGRLALVSGLVATAAYIAITGIFYVLFKVVNSRLSLIAAGFGMAGNLASVLAYLHRMPGNINVLIFFGFYCLLIGYLIVRSEFLPSVLGALMILSGVGYVTFLWPRLGNSLIPWNYIPGALGEWSLTIWLLVKGLDQQKWERQSTASQE